MSLLNIARNFVCSPTPEATVTDFPTAIQKTKVDGHARYFSKFFNEEVFIVADDAARNRLEIKEPGLIIYSLDEVGKIRNSRVSGVVLKRIHGLKKLLGVTIESVVTTLTT